ncbi:MAG: S8 family serine peptidase [Gammaproteobacteria bacterium]|nr:S8 family serine peptidase [Gammaproteobacteria bacterium]
MSPPNPAPRRYPSWPHHPATNHAPARKATTTQATDCTQSLITPPSASTPRFSHRWPHHPATNHAPVRKTATKQPTDRVRLLTPQPLTAAPRLFRRWPQCPAVAIAVVAVLVASCSGVSESDSDNTAAPMAMAAPPGVRVPLRQTIQVTLEKFAARSSLGRVAYTAAALDAGNALKFRLSGAGSEYFAVSEIGEITVVRDIGELELPISLVVTLAIADDVLATTHLSVERGIESADIVDRTTALTLPAAQQLVVTDRRRGARVGQIAFNTTPVGLSPALFMSGEGAEYFAVDSRGLVSVASAIEAAQFNFRLVLYAELPFLASPAQAAVTISSASVQPATPVPVPISAETLPPGARVFAAGSQHRISAQASGFSEATAPGACVVRFARTRPSDDTCWSFVQTPATITTTQASTTTVGSEHAIVYELADADEINFVVSGNLLLLSERLNFGSRSDPNDTPTTDLTVRVHAGFVGHDQTSEIDINLSTRAPRITYQSTTIDIIPVSTTMTDIGQLGFSISDGAPGRELQYSFENITSSFALSVGNDGVLRYDGARAALTANRRYAFTVVATINDFAPAGQVRRTIAFTTAPPQLSFAQLRHELTISPDANLAHVLVATIAARSVPTAEISYEISDDPGGQFYAGNGGQIFLNAALTSPASATLRAVAGTASTSTSFTVRAATIDFTAVPSGATGRHSIRFNPVVPSGLTATSYQWDFGDGTPVVTETAPVHQYARTGTYQVRLTVTTNTGTQPTAVHTVYPHNADDPYKRMQWHLRQNTASPFLGIISSGQLADRNGVLNDLELTTPVYSHYDTQTDMFTGVHTLTVAGEDIRAIDHLASCGVLDTCRGEGIVVLVADGGAQINHPDLVANTQRRLSRNLIQGAPDVYDPYTPPPASVAVAQPGSTLANLLYQANTNPTHATATAGVIVATDANDIGVVGVAPRAELASYNLLEAGVSNLSQAAVFGADHDVGNHSWATSSLDIEYTRLVQSSRDAIEQAVSQNRGGRGSVLIKSAGNHGAGNVFTTGVLAYPDAFGNRHNSGLDGHNAMPEILTVAGVRASGEENIQSEAGANVLISAYWNLPCRHTSAPEASLAISNPVGIVTTDLVGDLGVSWGATPAFLSALTSAPDTFLGTSNPLLTQAFAPAGTTPEITPLANMNDYHYCFNGTSGSAPQVSGAAALMLQARPELSWRDVRAILVQSARQNDTSNPNWASNGAGLNFHPAYGYGIVNTQAAVTQAKSWTMLPEEQSLLAPTQPETFTVRDCANNCGPDIANTGTSTTATINIAGEMTAIETVQVKLKISFATANRAPAEHLKGTIAIALVHRNNQGTILSRSLLQKRHPYYQNPNLGGGQTNQQTNLYNFEWTYLSVQHYNEDSTGTWNLEITDHIQDNAEIEIQEWQLQFRGHTP